MEKFMSERIDTKGRIKKFKEQDRHFLGLGCDNIEMDRTVRNVMSDLSGLEKDAAIVDAAIATSSINDDDDDDTAPMDSQPHEPRSHFGNRSRDQENVGRNEGDDDEGVLSSWGDPKDGRHKARDCWSKVVATGANAQPVVTCYGCGEKGHIKTNCPARTNSGINGACGQAYALRDGDQNLGPNVVTALSKYTNSIN
nr:hypothetical protein [Tanacetum cinerariifolium]